MRRRSFTGLSGSLRDGVTGPGFFIAAALVFLAASSAAATDPFLRELNPRVSVTPLTIGVFLFGLLSYYTGMRTGKPALGMKYAPLAAGLALGTLAIHFIFGVPVILALAFNALLFIMALVLLYSKLRFGLVFIAGLAMFWANLLMTGIPVLDPQMHAELFTVVNPLFVLGFFLMAYSLIRMHPQRRWLWAVALASATASSYRVYMAVVLVTWVWLELRAVKRIDPRKAGIAIAGIIAVSVAFLYIGHAAMTSDNPSWTLGPLRTLEYRLALTMGVFDDTVHLSFPFGYTFGQSITMEATEFTCRVLYGCEERITSTFFGEAMLDFGLIGVFMVSWFAGALLINLHRKDYPLYALLFASLLATIDVGFNIFVMLEFIYLGWTKLIIEERQLTGVMVVK